MTVQLRTRGDPLNYTNIARDAVAQVDPNAAVGGLKTQDAHIDQAISREITLARLSVIFAALALATASCPHPALRSERSCEPRWRGTCACTARDAAGSPASRPCQADFRVRKPGQRLILFNVSDKASSATSVS
jgi:hypothetical protein